MAANALARAVLRVSWKCMRRRALGAGGAHRLDPAPHWVQGSATPMVSPSAISARAQPMGFAGDVDQAALRHLAVIGVAEGHRDGQAQRRPALGGAAADGMVPSISTC